MNDDRTDPPDGMVLDAHYDDRYWCGMHVRQSSEADAIAAAWAFVDRIRQQERERLAKIMATVAVSGIPSGDMGWTRRSMSFAEIATWLRTDAKAI